MKIPQVAVIPEQEYMELKSLKKAFEKKSKDQFITYVSQRFYGHGSTLYDQFTVISKSKHLKKMAELTKDAQNKRSQEFQKRMTVEGELQALKSHWAVRFLRFIGVL